MGNIYGFILLFSDKMCSIAHKWLEAELYDLNFEFVDFITNYEGKLKVEETLQRSEIEHIVNGMTYYTTDKYIVYEVTGSLLIFINEFFKDNEEYLDEVLSKVKSLDSFRVEIILERDGIKEEIVIILNLT